MNKSIEQALTSLIPRYNGALPSELIELASSLLAQSRNKASNLKAEEEIGRAYACANIACERLKQSLNLPKIEPRPPCPPRIYKKLYSYLDSILLVRRSSRPPKPKSAEPTPTKALPSRPSPTKEASLAPYKSTPQRAPSSRRRGLQFGDSTKEIAHWIHPVIRGLCKEFEAPAAAPHILAGVTTILTLPIPSSNDDQIGHKEEKRDKIPALVAAVLVLVYTRLSGRETTGHEYVAQRRSVLNTLTELRDDEDLSKKIQAKAKQGTEWEGWEKVGTKEVDLWLTHISTQGWLTLDWFKNIVEGSGLDVRDDPTDSDLEAESDPVTAREGYEAKNALQSGFGTMLQDRVDYISEKKRAEYQIWKQGIIKRIRTIERGEEVMDTFDG